MLGVAVIWTLRSPPLFPVPANASATERVALVLYPGRSTSPVRVTDDALANVTCCSDCKPYIFNKNLQIPLLGLANLLWIGPTPRPLLDLTLAEQHLLRRAKVIPTLFPLVPSGGKGNANTTQMGARRNSIAFPREPEHLLRIFPLSLSEALADLLLFYSNEKDLSFWCNFDFQFRPDRVRQALLYLALHCPPYRYLLHDYSDTECSAQLRPDVESTIAGYSSELDENGVPQKLLQTATKTESTNIRSQGVAETSAEDDAEDKVAPDAPARAKANSKPSNSEPVPLSGSKPDNGTDTSTDSQRLTQTFQGAVISPSGPGARVLTSFEAAIQHLKATVDAHLLKSDSDPRPAFAAAQEALRRLQSVAADKDQNVLKDLFETYSVSVPTDAGDGGPIDLYDPTFWTAAFPYHFSHGDGVESLAKRPTRGLTDRVWAQTIFMRGDLDELPRDLGLIAVVFSRLLRRAQLREARLVLKDSATSRLMGHLAQISLEQLIKVFDSLAANATIDQAIYQSDIGETK